MPTFYGSILRKTDMEILISIACNKGDAREIGLSGEVWFAKRQIVQCYREEGFDVIKVPYAVAVAKAKTCQPCE